MTRHVIVSLIAACLFVGCASAIAQEKEQTTADLNSANMTQPGKSEAAVVNGIEVAAPSFEIAGNSATNLEAQEVFDRGIFEMATAQGSRQQTPTPNKKAETPKTQPPRRTSSSNPEPKWEIEVHGGISRNHQAGTSVTLPTAQTYSLAGSGAIGLADIRVSSWYFGPGATLINLTSPLDPILWEPILRPPKQIYGFRVSRTLTKRLAAEFTFDNGGRLAFTDQAINQVGSANLAFYNVWQRLNVAGNTPTTSVSTISAFGGRQIFTTGAFVISSIKYHKVRPFLVLGAGILTSNSTPSATLVGSYGGPDALETDTVRLSFAQDHNLAITGVVGGGLKIYLSQHLGIRFDVRAYLYSNPITTLLDANHTNTPDAAWVVNATGATSIPAFQRLIGPGLAAYSTLSGPALSGFQTFSESRIQFQAPVTLGFFWRF
jgi:hypothetical protein